MKSLKQPKGLMVIIFFQVLAGLLSLIGGIIPSVFSMSAQTQNLGFLQFLAPFLSIVLIVLGIFYLGLSFGLWKGYRWAWTASVVFILVHSVADIGFVASRSFAIDKFVGLVIIGLMLRYLFLPGVRAYFGKGQRKDGSSALSTNHAHLTA
jgi:hypothetical protein